MKQLKSIPGFMLLVAFALNGCAQSTSVVKLQGPDKDGTSAYQRLLVVDISNDAGQQQQFEAALVAGLRGKHVEAFEGYPRLDSSAGLPRASLEAYAAEISADGILVTNISSVSTSVDIEEGREQLMSTCRRGDPIDYFLYDHEVLKEPDAVKVAHTVVVIASLYDTASQERVWAIESTCFNKATMNDVLSTEAKTIVQQLADDDLI